MDWGFPLHSCVLHMYSKVGYFCSVHVASVLLKQQNDCTCKANYRYGCCWNRWWLRRQCCFVIQHQKLHVRWQTRFIVFKKMSVIAENAVLLWWSIHLIISITCILSIWELPYCIWSGGGGNGYLFPQLRGFGENVRPSIPYLRIKKKKKSRLACAH